MMKENRKLANTRHVECLKSNIGIIEDKIESVENAFLKSIMTHWLDELKAILVKHDDVEKKAEDLLNQEELN